MLGTRLAPVLPMTQTRRAYGRLDEDRLDQETYKSTKQRTDRVRTSPSTAQDSKTLEQFPKRSLYDTRSRLNV